MTEPLKHAASVDKDHPGSRFAPGFWGEQGIERIHEETGGWPHLVQLLAGKLVDLLNKSQQSLVDDPLFQRGLEESVELGNNVLSQLVRGECGLPGEWDYLTGFKRSEVQPPPDDPSIARSLRRRLLVTVEGNEWRMRVPLMRRWLINYD